MTDINELVGPEPVPVPSPKFPTPWGTLQGTVIDASGRYVLDLDMPGVGNEGRRRIAAFVAEAVNEKVARGSSSPAVLDLPPILKQIREATGADNSESTLSAVERVVAELDSALALARARQDIVEQMQRRWDETLTPLRDALSTTGDPLGALQKLINSHKVLRTDRDRFGTKLGKITELLHAWRIDDPCWTDSAKLIGLIDRITKIVGDA